MNPNGTPANLRPFKPGQTGNAGGKPVSARNRLQGAFMSDLCADWDVNGMRAIERCREEDPARYLTIVAGIVGKTLGLPREPEPGEFASLSIDELLSGVAMRD